MALCRFTLLIAKRGIERNMPFDGLNGMWGECLAKEHAADEGRGGGSAPSWPCGPIHPRDTFKTEEAKDRG